MKEIKAFIHRNRAADVIGALKAAGHDNLTVVDVKGMLQALDARERDYSVELGEEAITEVKVEVVCDDDRVDDIVAAIREKGRTGQPQAGWIYVSEIQAAYPVGDP